MTKDYESKVKNILRDNGYKFTNQRRDIYTVFMDNKGKHLTTEDVFNIVKKQNSDLGIATVYRTILLFENLGIISRLSFEDGVIRYELKCDDTAHRHHHLICLDCHKISEVKVDLLETLENKIEKNENFKIVDHNLEFYGYCASCQEKRSKDEKQ